MNEVLTVGLAGFAASLVDGALGMGFGLTSSSILLSSGLSPAAAATTVNIAKVATGLASGASHWKLDNIDRRLVLRLALPGAFGALLGVTILTNVDGATLKPILAALLLLLGLRLLHRFSTPVAAAVDGPTTARQLRGIEVAGVAGGVTNGLIGAWGPVVTPFLLHRRLPPRIVVGSVNTAEVAVAVVAAGSLLSTRPAGVAAPIIVAMLLGGVVAAPLAAWTIRFIPARVLGVMVAGLLLTTNVRDLAAWAELGALRWLAYATIALGVGVALIRPAIMSTEAADPERAIAVG